MKRFTGAYPGPRRPDQAACDLCQNAIGPEHRHVLDLERQLSRCACVACALLFAGARLSARYRTIEDRVLVDPELTLDEALWVRLEIPVRLAFFSWEGAEEAEAVYPAASGTAWAPVPPQAWAELAQTRLVKALRPRVDALLVSGLAHPPAAPGALACFGVSIDRCFALMGLLRKNWRGFSGGPELWRALDGYLADLRARAERLACSEGVSR